MMPSGDTTDRIIANVSYVCYVIVVQRGHTVKGDLTKNARKAREHKKPPQRHAAAVEGETDDYFLLPMPAAAK